jgi:subtilisin family serine protease
VSINLPPPPQSLPHLIDASTRLASRRKASSCRSRVNIAIIAISTVLASIGVSAEAPYLPTAKPIKDNQGRVQVVIDFTDDAHESYSRELAIRTDEKTTFHRFQTLNLIADYEARYKFSRIGLTSWVGNSVTTFLAADQIRTLRADNRVKLISDDGISSYSVGPAPAWGNLAAGLETQSWGRVATNGKVNAGTNRKVYVIDSGVADHADFRDTNGLNDIVTRTNVACGTSWQCQLVDPTTYPVVGCYSHGTHVAGIIGARANNNKTTAGVYAGVKMVSVAVTSRTGNVVGNCGDNSGPAAVIFDPNGVVHSRIGYALDFVYWDTANNNGGLVSIVNISMNSGAMGWLPSNGTWVSENNYSKVRKLATPAYYVNNNGGSSFYQGAFVAQSSGNYGANACGYFTDASWGTKYSYAYNPGVGLVPGIPPQWTAIDNDGIMVVGAIHHTGAPVTAAVPFSASYPAGLTGAPLPSNYGACVDVWAPGNAIVSTWGLHVVFPPNAQTVSGVSTPYAGNPVSGTQGWAFLSGTSMAAPHVAGAAAYLADQFGLTSPAAIEAKVRAYMVQYNGNTDSAGLPVKMVQLP